MNCYSRKAVEINVRTLKYENKFKSVFDWLNKTFIFV